MSTNFDVACYDCEVSHHLGQRMANSCSFGYGTGDVKGAAQAAEFIHDHLGHTLVILETDQVPEWFDIAF